MSARKSFLIIIKIIFIFSSLQFLRDSFYKWDGYSYYMKFTEFLPDLSLMFIIYTFLWIVLALILWLIFSIVIKLTSKFLLINIKYEHLLIWFTVGVFILTIKLIFLKGISLTKLTGLSYSVNLLVIGGLVALLVWLIRKYTENILNELDSRITPLFWLFIFILIFSLPLSMIKGKRNIESQDVQNNLIKKQSVNSSEKKLPNIILVIMDALTARDMQLYGYHRPTTPFISKWAKNAIVFTRAYSSSNWTTPSMMSIMTGQRPWTHGVWYMAYYNPVDNYENNLPKLLKEYGYNLYSFVQNPYAHPTVLGIDNIFQVKNPSYKFSIPSGLSDRIKIFFIDRPIVAEWVLQIRPFSRILKYFTPTQYSTTKPSEIVYNSFLEYLSHHKKQPFFAWLHVWPPHEFYLPPKPYKGIFGDSEKFDTDKEQHESGLLYREYEPERQKDVDLLRKRYDEFILYSDKQFELFLSRLTDMIDMSNTIIILTSDHGESFSHGYQAHLGPHLYEQLVHVPLIIKIPMGTNVKVIDIPVEQIDIAPTILDLVGIPIPSWMEGRSLVPLFKGKTLKPRPIFSMQLIKNRIFGRPITKGTIAIWDGNYKFIYYLENKKSLLFNLHLDPNETQNISEQYPQVVQNFVKLIEENLSLVNTKIIHSNKN